MVKSMGVGDTVFRTRGGVLRFRRREIRRPNPTTPDSSWNFSELPINSSTEYEGGNLGHRIRTKAGYFPVPPQDSAQDMRSEMLGAMAKMGVKVEKHHHEVASAQHELGMKFDTMTLMADQMQIYKYCIQQVAHIYGKTATFMPKPVFRRQRLGHALPSVDLEGWQAGFRRRPIRRPLGDLPALHWRDHEHAEGRQRLHQPQRPTPTSVSFPATKRRCCSPIPRATVRLPAAFPTPPIQRPSASRCVSPIRSPIPIFGFAAMLMAGLDGIKNKIDPGPAMDKDLYEDLPKGRVQGHSDGLRLAPRGPGKSQSSPDRTFLKNGGVFDDDFIDSYLELKMTEVARFEMTPHPVEFEMYYSG